MDFYDINTYGIKVELVTELPTGSDSNAGRIVFSLTHNAFFFGMHGSGWMGLGTGSIGCTGESGNTGGVGPVGPMGLGKTGNTGGTGENGINGSDKEPILFDPDKVKWIFHEYDTTQIIISLYDKDLNIISFDSSYIYQIHTNSLGLKFPKELLETYDYLIYVFILPLSTYIETLKIKHKEIFDTYNYKEIIQLEYNNKSTNHLIDKIEISNNCNIITPNFFIDYSGNLYTSEILSNLLNYQDCQTAELLLHIPITGYLFIDCLEIFNPYIDPKYHLEDELFYSSVGPYHLKKEGYEWSVTHSYGNLIGLLDRKNFTIEVFDEEGNIIPVFPFNGKTPHKKYYYELNPSEIPPLYQQQYNIIENKIINLDDGKWHYRDYELDNYKITSKTNPNIYHEKLKLFCPINKSNLLYSSYDINTLSLLFNNSNSSIFKILNNNLLTISNSNTYKTIISSIIKTTNYKLTTKLLYDSNQYYKNNYSPDYLSIIIAKSFNNKTLSLVISCYDESSSKVEHKYNSFSIVYNLGQSGETIISDGSSLIDSIANWSVYPKGLNISVDRCNDMFVCRCNNHEITFDLNSNNLLTPFKEPCQIGFGVLAQTGAIFKDVTLIIGTPASEVPRISGWDFEHLDENNIKIVFFKLDRTFPVKHFQKGSVKITFNGTVQPLSTRTGEVVHQDYIITEELYEELLNSRSCSALYIRPEYDSINKKPILLYSNQINEQVTSWNVQHNLNRRDIIVKLFELKDQENQLIEIELDPSEYEVTHLTMNCLIINNNVNSSLSKNIVVSPLYRSLKIEIYNNTNYNLPLITHSIKDLNKQHNKYNSKLQKKYIHKHIQNCNNYEWIINHNLNTKNISIHAYDNNNNKIGPDQSIIIDNNTIKIKFLYYTKLDSLSLDHSWLFNRCNIPIYSDIRKFFNYQKLLFNNYLSKLATSYFNIHIYSYKEYEILNNPNKNPNDPTTNYTIISTCDPNKYEYTGATGQPGYYEITSKENIKNQIPIIFLDIKSNPIIPPNNHYNKINNRLDKYGNYIWSVNKMCIIVDDRKLVYYYNDCDYNDFIIIYYDHNWCVPPDVNHLIKIFQKYLPCHIPFPIIPTRAVDRMVHFKNNDVDFINDYTGVPGWIYRPEEEFEYPEYDDHYNKTSCYYDMKSNYTNKTPAYWTFTGGTGELSGIYNENWIHDSNNNYIEHKLNNDDFYYYKKINVCQVESISEVYDTTSFDGTSLNIFSKYDTDYECRDIDIRCIKDIDTTSFCPDTTSISPWMWEDKMCNPYEHLEDIVYNTNLPLTNKLLINPHRYITTTMFLDEYNNTDPNPIIINNDSTNIKYTYTPQLKYIPEIEKIYYKITGEYIKYNNKYINPFCYEELHIGQFGPDYKWLDDNNYITSNRYTSGKAIIINLDEPDRPYSLETHPKTILFEQDNPNTYVWIISHNWNNLKHDIKVYTNDNILVSNEEYIVKNYNNNTEIWWKDGLVHQGFALLSLLPLPDIKTQSAYSGTGGTGGTGYISRWDYVLYRGSTGETGGSGRTGFTGHKGCTGGFGETGKTGGTGGTGQTGITGHTGETGKTGGIGGCGATGGTGDNAPDRPTGGTGNSGFRGRSGGTGHTGETGGTGFIGGPGPIGGTGEPGTGPTGSTGGIGKTGFSGQTGHTGHTGEVGTDFFESLDFLNISHIRVLDESYMRKYTYKVSSEYYKYMFKPKSMSFRLFKVHPNHYSDHFFAVGLPFSIIRDVESLEDTEIIELINKDNANPYKLSITDNVLRKTELFTFGDNSINNHIHINGDLNQIVIEDNRINAVHNIEHFITDNISDGRTNGFIQVKNIPNFSYNKKNKLVLDLNSSILSGDILPWTYYLNIEYSKFYDYTHNNENIQFEIKIKTDVYIHGALYSDLMLLLKNT